MRSRSLATRSAPTISRRSTAIGWRRAMVRIAFSSISRCSASIVASAAITLAGELDVAARPARATASAISLLGKAAHLGDHAGQLLQVGVEGLGDMFGHCDPCSLPRVDAAISRSGR